MCIEIGKNGTFYSAFAPQKQETLCKMHLYLDIIQI